MSKTTIDLRQLLALNMLAKRACNDTHNEWVKLVKAGEDVSDHMYSIAVRGLWGDQELEDRVNDVHIVRSDEAEGAALCKANPWPVVGRLAKQREGVEL